MRNRRLSYLLGLVLCAHLAACGTGSDSGEQDSKMDESSIQTRVTTTQSGGLSNDSRISLRLADAPIDNLVKVIIEFTAVELMPQAGGWIRFTLATPKSIDLMQLQSGNTADLLINVPAPADDYKEIRLYTGSGAMANYVEERGGGIEPLQIPGGSGSGLRLRQDFTVPAAQTGSFIIDFDLRQSVRSTGASGNYELREVMSLLAVSDIGGFRSEVNPALLSNPPPLCSDALVDTHNVAYVFDGHNVTPDDINQLDSSPGNIEPVSTTMVNYDPGSGKYIYEAAFLAAGNYTVAVTCNADQDDLEATDDLQFFDVQNVTVIENNLLFL